MLKGQALWLAPLMAWQDENRITDNQLDALLGVHRSGLIHKAKKRAASGGNISVSTLVKLAAIMKVSPYRLLGGVGTEEE